MILTYPMALSSVTLITPDPDFKFLFFVFEVKYLENDTTYNCNYCRT